MRDRLQYYDVSPKGESEIPYLTAGADRTIVFPMQLIIVFLTMYFKEKKIKWKKYKIICCVTNILSFPALAKNLMTVL